MPQLTTQLIAEPRYLGGVFVELDAAYDNADYSETFIAFMPELEKQHEEMFQNEKDSGGNPWAPLAASTIRRKGHNVILHETGRLGASLFGDSADSIRDAEDRFMVFGTDVPYAIFHDEGTSRMPARPPVGIAESVLDSLVNKIADSLIEQLTG